MTKTKDARCNTCNTPIVEREFVFDCPMCGETKKPPIEAQEKHSLLDHRLLYPPPASAYEGIQSWKVVDFVSSSSRTPQFDAFYKDFIKELRTQLKPFDMQLVKLNKGHFYVSGFVLNKYLNQYVYFSTADVRHFRNEWLNNILIRTAEGDFDYHGGRNHYTILPMFGSEVYELMTKGQ